MTKPPHVTLRPLTPAELAPRIMPKKIQDQNREADNIWRELERKEEEAPKPGRPRNEPDSKPRAGLSANTEVELNALIAAHITAVGERKQGNKRIGGSVLYAKLVQHFALLKRHGVTLPRGGSLDKDAVSFGLGEILRDHGKTTENDEKLIANGEVRYKIGHNMSRIFSRVADAVEKYPAIMAKPPQKTE